MSEKRKIAKKRNPNFMPDGKFAKGNTIGRMKKKGFTLTDLNKIAFEYGKTKNKDLLEHYISRLYRNDTLLQNFIEKNVPTKQLQEIAGDITYVLERVKYEQNNKNKD